MTNIPIIIDADPGIDDFFAIMLAKSCRDFEIKGITTVAGNQILEKTTQNALQIATLLGIDTRIGKGATGPIHRELEIAGNVHGENGLGGVRLPAAICELDKDYAWDVIYQEAVKAKGRLKLIAVGPLTNVAIAILKYPDLHQYLDEIVMMGGSTGIGNHGAYGEFNIWVDPEAADIVFKAGIPLTMVGLNVTMATGITAEELEDILAIECKHSQEVTELFRFMQASYKKLGHDFVAIHDALAVAYVMDKEVLSCKPYYVTIETRSTLNRGRTVVDLDNSHRDKVSNAKVAMEVHKDKFIELLKNMFKYYN